MDVSVFNHKLRRVELGIFVFWFVFVAFGFVVCFVVVVFAGVPCL